MELTINRRRLRKKSRPKDLKRWTLYELMNEVGAHACSTEKAEIDSVHSRCYADALARKLAKRRTLNPDEQALFGHLMADLRDRASCPMISVEMKLGDIPERVRDSVQRGKLILVNQATRLAKYSWEKLEPFANKFQPSQTT